MSLEAARVPLSKLQLYFGSVLSAFLLSFLLYDSAKFTNNLFYACMALPGLFFLLKSKGGGVFSQPLGRVWAAFMLWFLVPAVYAGDFQFYKHIAYVSLFVFIIAALVPVRLFNGGLFVRGLFWAVCLYLYASSLHSWMTGQFVFGQRVAILPGRLSNVIYASALLVCALALALPLWVRQRRWIEAFCAVLLTLLAAAVVVQTRTALVGIAVVFGLWALWILYRYPRRGSLALAGSVLVVVTVVWLCWEDQWVRLLFVRGDSFRIELFEIMTDEWRHCGWLLGCGVDFQTTRTLTGGIPIQHPHNVFVAMGLYFGAVSLVLFVAVMGLTLWQAWRQRDPWGCYLLCALVMLNFDGSKLVGNPDELWLLILLPAAMILARKVQKNAGIAPGREALPG